ncbi:MAG: hypothetical protein JWP66_1697 [Naasia sp.]|nr:hypothetical protein [Naasia sp.]
MIDVLLVCVAGVSGTFLARRMQALAPDLVVRVTALETLAPEDTATGVLLAPQLADRLDAVRVLVAPLPVALLPADALAPDGAAAAVAQARELGSAPAYGGATSLETKE